MEDRLKTIQGKKELYNSKKHLISKPLINKYELDFAIRYAHESTKIEGNTLTLLQNKMVIEEGLSVGGKPLREVYEVVNHNRAFNYTKENVKNKVRIDSNVVKDIHQILMDNIVQGGVYRYVDVIISGASNKPPSRTEMYDRLNKFYFDLENNVKNVHPIEKAAWVHAEFVSIHPFIDGNGRTSRVLMNYTLMENGYLPVNIPDENKENYYTVLDLYMSGGSLVPFVELLIDLEEEQLDVMLSLITNKTKLF